jgi:hypothetical protein
MTRVLERGDVFFFYRPKVDADEVRSLDDVARFFFVLDPDELDWDRMVVVGRKRLRADEAAEEELEVPLETESETLATSELLADLGLRPGELPLEPWVQGKLR